MPIIIWHRVVRHNRRQHWRNSRPILISDEDKLLVEIREQGSGNIRKMQNMY